jgi:protein involved in polysaccharide export with SLBB domain
MNASWAQSLPDFGTVDVKELSDSQLQLLLRRSKSLGIDSDDLVEMAQIQGLSLEDARLLETRLKSYESRRVSQGVNSVRTANGRQFANIPDLFTEILLTDTSTTVSKIFGMQYFGATGLLSFEPDLNITAPENYQLSFRDQLYIDIYGESEQYFDASINEQGAILLSNVGPIPVNGLTMKEAENRIRAKLSEFYTGMNGDNPNTFVKVSLGNIRTIRVDIVGEVVAPGSYKLSGFNTVFNALYAAGGITEEGTFRVIKHFRGGELLQTVDLYDFLVAGKTDANLTLQNGDVILVDTYQDRVEISGAMKRAGIFEVKEGETLADLIFYAGGFNEQAKSERVSLQRNAKDQKSLIDVFENQYEAIYLKAGDVVKVDTLLDRFVNRVLIQGAVFRPGAYSMEQASSVKELIERADGLQGDAYLKRATLIRTNEDFSTENISFSPQEILTGTQADIQLKREDKVQVFSKFDLEEEAIIEITGEVNQPAVIPYRKDMSLGDAILAAGGLRFVAERTNIEVTRIKIGEEDEIAELINLSMNEDYSVEADFDIQPFDKITVRRSAYFEPRISVMIEGEVNYPGQYDLQTRTEKISDLLTRAGGLRTLAYSKGATLIRRTENFQTISENQAQIERLKKIKMKLDSATDLLTENELMMKDRVAQEIENLSANDRTRSDQFTNQIKNERLNNIRERNGLESNVQVGNYESVGIRLDKILASPGGAEDLLLEDGDVIVIPKQSETVRLRGSIVFPTTLKFDQGKKAKAYINRAGGFASRAKRKQTYVIYANGEVARTKSFLFIKNYPRVEPGADIIVPTKGAKNPLGVQQALAVTSALATIALLISQINFN